MDAHVDLRDEIALESPSYGWPRIIRLEMEFVYLAVILDAYSGRVLGWTLDRGLQDELTITGFAWH